MNIIVTGASKGIGYETVLYLAGKPDLKVLAIGRSEDKLKQLLSDCKKINATSAIEILTFDLLEKNFEKNLLPEILKRFHSIDVLLNNAGFLVNKSFEKSEEKEWSDTFETNFFAPVRLIKTLLPHFNSKKSHIVNISSMGGFQGSQKFPGLSAYSASKAALANLTECLAEELKEKNIYVNCLALGSVQTEMLEEAFPDYKASFSPTEMGKFIAEFCLSGQQYYNGKIIPVSLATP